MQIDDVVVFTWVWKGQSRLTDMKEDDSENYQSNLKKKKVISWPRGSWN